MLAAITPVMVAHMTTTLQQNLKFNDSETLWSKLPRVCSKVRYAILAGMLNCQDIKDPCTSQNFWSGIIVIFGFVTSKSVWHRNDSFWDTFPEFIRDANMSTQIPTKSTAHQVVDFIKRCCSLKHDIKYEAKLIKQHNSMSQLFHWQLCLTWVTLLPPGGLSTKRIEIT